MTDTKIELTPETAVVLWDIVDSMFGAGDPERIAESLRCARFVRPKLAEAFLAAGITPDEIERPEIPLMKPHWAT